MTDPVVDPPLPPSRNQKHSPFVGLIAIGSGMIVLFFLIYSFGRSQQSPSSTPQAPPPPPAQATPGQPVALKSFSSQEEFEDFIKSQSGASPFLGLEMGMTGGALRDMVAMPEAAPQALGKAPVGTGAEEYSTTNIQVAGVDEADIVKNDGKYIYLVSGKKVVIIDAYPAEEARIISEIDVGGTPAEVFINRNRLVVFGQEQEAVSSKEPRPLEKKMVSPTYDHRQQAFIRVYDLSDRLKPRRTQELITDGSYYDSRMIGDYVYGIIHHPTFYRDDVFLPAMTEDGKTVSINPTEISYFSIPYYEPRLTTIVALNTQDEKKSVVKKTYLTDGADNLYVSTKNIFLVQQRRLQPYETEARLMRQVYLPLLPKGIVEQFGTTDSSNRLSPDQLNAIGRAVEDYVESLTPDQQEQLRQRFETELAKLAQRIAKDSQKTVIHRIQITNGKVRYQAQGEVPGRVLNQFSMDEYQNWFRIATTTDGFFGVGAETAAANHLYVLNKDLKIVGRLEDLAPGETIRSARFMGKRAYLVTFRKTDPLFAIDLSNPKKPEVLGKLKIPGYSDYLHPYDENHLIGIGKEAVAAEEGDFAWFQGIKIALFDVTDPTKPKQLASQEIGDRGTDSYVLQEHKAFLFDRPKNLMVVPILLAKIDEEKYPQGVPPSMNGDYVWQGAYVFDISTRGIAEKGRVTHQDQDDDSFLKSGFYISSPLSIKRSLYIGDTLYTVSDRMVKMNDLVSLEEINKVKLSPGETEPQVFYKGLEPPIPPAVIDNPPTP